MHIFEDLMIIFIETFDTECSHSSGKFTWSVKSPYVHMSGISVKLSALVDLCCLSVAQKPGRFSSFATCEKNGQDN